MQSALPLSQTVPVTPGEGITYTVPQTLTMPTIDKTIEIHFRVNRKFGKSEVILSNHEGSVLKRFAREQMTPGEIEKIVLPTSLLLDRALSHLILSASETISPSKEVSPS